MELVEVDIYISKNEINKQTKSFTILNKKRIKISQIDTIIKELIKE